MAVSRGFHRRRVPADAGRVPPGQYVTEDYPVLSAGPTPHPPLADWTFTIRGEVSEPVSWTWDQLRALPSESVTADIHCVTKWTKLDTTWTVYVCGPTSFVETATSALVALGHDSARIRAERFGGPGRA